MTADLTNLRAEFRENGLNRSELDNDPFNQFSLWFSQAIKSGIVEPSAMSSVSYTHLTLPTICSV